jgi:phenylalanyl-tRNA synthetase alpha chain
LIQEIEQVQVQALAELQGVATLDALYAWRNRFYLGKTSALGEISKGLGKLSPDERPRVGQSINAAKQALEAAYATCESAMQQRERERELREDLVDVTLPGRPSTPGSLHPTTQIIREIERVFLQMGFVIWESREVESDLFNFQLLNIPPDHPARDMWDTFYVRTSSTDERVVLRTHTSPGQIHAMRRFAPEPIRVLLPGKCFRYEPVTARHESIFHQFEFLVIGENITMADLTGTLAMLAEGVFGEGTRVRLRPSYFPFTEPSAELDISCNICKGVGCRICKQTGWLELGGCGMVHPVVLRNGGYDPDQFSGFAGGFGYERSALMRYGIDDIRLFFANDLRFLEQFGS